MGFGGISIWQLLIVLAIIVLLFGTKKLRNIGADLGNAVKGFKKAVNTDNEPDDSKKNSNIDKHSHEKLNVEDNETAASSKDSTKTSTEKL